jgi:hypothetical protein
VLIRKSIRI